MNRLFVSLLIVVVLLMNVGCSSVANLRANLSDRDAAINFTIDDIQATEQPGNVNLQGSASLPDETELAVSAVRLLSDTAPVDTPQNRPSYAILDRQFATVESGKWQAELALWQLTANGSPFESWQVSTNLVDEDLTPDSNVMFIVTLEPTSFTLAIEETLAGADINSGNSRVSYTPSGEPYLQISQVMSVQTPSRSPQSAQAIPTKTDEFWRERSPNSLDTRSSDEIAPLPFAQEDNLALPADSMMQ